MIGSVVFAVGVALLGIAVGVGLIAWVLPAPISDPDESKVCADQTPCPRGAAVVSGGAAAAAPAAPNQETA